MTTSTTLIVPPGSRLAPGRLYLQLCHGREDPDEEMNIRGFDGPVFGPLASVMQTYLTTIRLTGEHRDELRLEKSDDMIAWEGSYYGDLAIFVATATDEATEARP